MATSSGPRRLPTGQQAEVKPGQYQKPKGAPEHPQTTKRMPLPTGPSEQGKIPQGKLNPNSKHANE